MAGVAAVITSRFFLGNNISTHEDLYNAVINYDYAKGKSTVLEDRIETALENSTTQLEFNYALKAKAEYYYRFNKFYTVITTLQVLEQYKVDTDDAIYVAEFYVKAYEALNNDTMVAVYQQQYDNLTGK